MIQRIREFFGASVELDADVTQALNLLELEARGIVEKAKRYDETQEVNEKLVEAAMVDVETLEPEPEPSNGRG